MTRPRIIVNTRAVIDAYLSGQTITAIARDLGVDRCVPMRVIEEAGIERDWATSMELVAEAGVTFRQLDYWVRNGLLIPLDGPTPGSGQHRRYDEGQLAIGITMGRLTKAGLPPKQSYAIALQLVEQGTARLGDFRLIPVGDDAA